MTALQILQAAGKSLTDYSNVVVVDPSGNGDYTTLAAAMAAITDASSSNRYVALVFGNVTETTDVTCKDYVDVLGMGGVINLTGFAHLFFEVTQKTHYRNLYVVGSPSNNNIYIGAGARLYNCDLTAYITNVSSGGVVYGSRLAGVLFPNASLELKSCYFQATVADFLTGIEIGSGITLSLLDCVVDNPDALNLTSGLVRLVGGGTLIGQNTRFFNSAASLNTITMLNAANLALNGCRVEAAGANGYGLNITLTPASLLVVNTLFKALTANRAVRASASYTNAPFYHCQFAGGTTNVTANAGTANGTNVSF
jgi:hypothetical protein